MRTLVLVAFVFATTLGCSGGGQYVWVNQLPPDQTADGSRLKEAAMTDKLERDQAEHA